MSRREQFLINSYQPAAEGSTYGHGTVREPGIFGSRREATYSESRKGIQSKKYKDILRNLKFNLRMTPASFKALVARAENQLGHKINFPSGSDEAKIMAGRVPTRWERASEGRIQSQYDIMEDSETINLLDSTIRSYNESLKDPNEQAQLQADIEKEQFLANPKEGLKIYNENRQKGDDKLQDVRDTLTDTTETVELPITGVNIRDTSNVKTKETVKKVTKPQPWKNKGGFTPNAAQLRRATGININDPRGKRAWQKLVNSNQVFDTTEKFGDDGGFFVTDNRGIPRFVKHQGG